MIIRIPASADIDLEAVFAEVSRTLFNGNATLDLTYQRRTSRSIYYRAKFGVADSYGHGARVAASGRHGAWACWHVVRDALAAWFDVAPSMVVRSAFAVYVGADGFERDFPRTYHHNVGSAFQPATIGGLCQCAEDQSDIRDVQPIGALNPTSRTEDRPRRARRDPEARERWEQRMMAPELRESAEDETIARANAAMRAAYPEVVGFDAVGIPVLSGDRG